MASPPPGILILAAGLGRRYTRAGGVGNKLMSCHTGSDARPRPIFDICLHHAQASGLPLHIVLRPEAVALQAIARRYGASFSMLASEGMGHSIARGVRDTPAWSGWLIQPADMTHIRPGDYQRLAAALTRHSQARLYWQGAPGHPVAFSARWRDSLTALSGDVGAKSLLTPAELLVLEAHPGVLIDHDLPPSSAHSCAAQYRP
ncbi:NTP transferase domain-containing protein [Shimwellia blattae]|uniref:MobA-like NTP transferase domain-containing protein n=1 Tax=Shimwellia blattae (strain ATCC 29907 / DSM 4481 / JCM 1650 / NBRC 105725 / CDC 9005-74) TaxID=630626 RepID=I2B7U7_SHIBC|nr:NTP transferase domain-containing protein [Shimwellia blattae]AFJ46601.1 hypothetical protein EBL_c14990 [Shimwellia blattae DSM 4481 = NBRC 105725]GAB80181.1 hypothetical protein EB105725_04_02910 [Shimwellia blattae DSM 4481 = NBRC 105725]VDY64073.1 molybdenum hydroxylase accessory protein, YgfJ family [Shimwellia blattae]VEC22205.1 molybdenum hydroxylase accessory protein, YgfJ family [Shimwellia blattae]